MEPFSAIFGAIGLGSQILGGIFGSSDAERASQIQNQMVGQERQLETQRQQQMMLNSRRQQMEILRNNQRARAMATNAAVNQGAQFGSGLAGGLAQISDASNSNLLATDQNLQIGKNMFGINSQLSNLKMQLGDVQSDLATDQGIMSLGGSLLKAGPTLGRLSQGFGGFHF